MELCVTVTDVRPVGGFRLELVFSDGQGGVVDLAARIFGRGGDFRALEDPAFFRRVRVDPELGTIVWPNDVDFCPELLRQWVAAGRVPAYAREDATPVVN
ncbi:MAG: DUF2442 domain-containing protein [Candidatus Anammoximicrobium sp.]|nr:DUF2442 domain-containing protein [Candidatus Anammoximicrobium sp.]